MKNLPRTLDFPWTCRFAGVPFFTILVLWLGSTLLYAQQKEAPASPTCAPANLTALMVPAGPSVQVAPVDEPSFRNPQESTAPATADSAPSIEARRARERAYKILEREAIRGSAAAQVNLAVASLAGWGVAANAGAALHWLHAAADKGYAPANFDLAVVYARGCGVRQDFAEALRFFQAAANSGNRAAAVNLGYLYDQGLGVAQDRPEAARWYRQAAEQGDAKAQYNLADMYLRGAGVPLDESLAFSWFHKAAVQGHSGARIMLGSMLASGRGTNKDLQSAYLWLSAASLQGDPRGDATRRLLEHQLRPEQIAQGKSQARSLLRSNPQSPAFALLQ
jgi:TPR repeat protein